MADAPQCPQTLVDNPDQLGDWKRDVVGQRFGERSLGVEWWTARLDEIGLGDEMFGLNDGHLGRGDLFDLGSLAAESAQDARRLLWATLAWGTDSSNRGNRKRIASVALDPDGVGQVLRRAAEIARNSPEDAFLALRPAGKNAVPYLGPPYFTKFLYFATGADPSSACLILDSRVAARIADRRGPVAWRGFRRGYRWTSGEYARYVLALHSWADELTRGGREVRADQIEYWLWNRR